MDWHPITDNLSQEIKYSANLLLYSPELVDLDFNPNIKNA